MWTKAEAHGMERREWIILKKKLNSLMMEVRSIHLMRGKEHAGYGRLL